jgi:hypothetical protein
MDLTPLSDKDMGIAMERLSASLSAHRDHKEAP